MARKVSAEQIPGSFTRTEVLDAAARLIVEEGYEAFTVRAVAERVQIKAGSLYYHFASKDGIVDEILNSGLDMMLAEVQSKTNRLPSNVTFAERLEVAVSARISCMVSRSALYMQVYDLLPPALKRKNRAMRRKYIKFWVDLFEGGIRSGEIDPKENLSMLVFFFLGSLNRMPEWLLGSKFKTADAARIATYTLLNGISRKTKGARSRKPTI